MLKQKTKYLKLKYTCKINVNIRYNINKISTSRGERNQRSSALRSRSGPIHSVFPADNAQLVKPTYF